jgi:hypothetical protein
MTLLRTLSAITAATLVAASGIGGSATSAQAVSEASVPERVLPVLAAKGNTARASCKACGRIESSRLDQYTVRMGDGSSRVFDEMPGVTWRLGERLMFIE